MAITRRVARSSSPAKRERTTPSREVRKLPWYQTPRGRVVHSRFVIDATLAILNDPYHSQGPE